MKVFTQEDDFEYQMGKIIEKTKKDYPELNNLNADDLQDKLWSEKYAVQFARNVLDFCQEYSGDELFE
jgi:hypothetical protein